MNLINLIREPLDREALKVSASAEKSILLHCCPPFGSTLADLRPPADTWLIINHSSDGPKISKIFDEVPREQPDINFRRHTSCTLVGSSLYVIGGQLGEGSSPYNFYRLDTLNPADGWKTCTPLPFECARPYVLVAGNFLCLLPDYGDFKTAGGDLLWGYVYDTIEDKGHPMEPPPTNCGPESYFPLVWGNRLGLVPLVEGELGYLYNTDKKSWEPDYNRELGPCNAPFRGVQGHYAFSDGIHYVYSFGSMFLYAYDSHSRRFYKILLPQIFECCPGPEATGCNMVAIGDSKLCFLWNSIDPFDDYFKPIIAYYKMKVSLHPFPDAIVLNYKEFGEPTFYLHQCLTFDSYPHLNEEISVSTSSDTGKQGDSYPSLTEEIPISKSNETTQNCDSYPHLIEEISISTSNDTGKHGDSYSGLTEEIPISPFKEMTENGTMELDHHSLFGECLRLQKENQQLLEKLRRTPIVSEQNISKILCPSRERMTVSSSCAHVIASPNNRRAPVVSSLKGSYNNGNQYLARGLRFMRNCIQK